MGGSKKESVELEKDSKRKASAEEDQGTVPTKQNKRGKKSHTIDEERNTGLDVKVVSPTTDDAPTVDQKKNKKKSKEEKNKKKQKKKFAAFIAENDFDEKCKHAFSKLTDEQAKEVMRRAKRAEVDTSKGSFSLLVTAICKQERQAGKLKPLEWPEQAGPERIEYNRLLRERFASNPEALTDVELERAKVLVARDERKKASKKGKNASAKNVSQKPQKSNVK